MVQPRFLVKVYITSDGLRNSNCQLHVIICALRRSRRLKVVSTFSPRASGVEISLQPLASVAVFDERRKLRRRGILASWLPDGTGCRIRCQFP